MRLQSEFATVEVSLEQKNGSTLLRVEDLLRDRVRYLDPEEVSSLARLRTGCLDDMLPY